MFTCLSLVFIILCQSLLSECSISCRNMNGDAVDWFIVYKLPTLEDDPDPMVKEGFAYYYMDVNNPSWTLGKVSLNKTGHAISHTLQQIYDNHKSKDVMYIIYNDETPEKNVSFTHGHTKGDLCFDKKSGFWLVHSLPRFPPRSDAGYRYPHSGKVYGQTFLCVTYPANYLNDIGEQLLYNYPQIYDYNVPDGFQSDNPNIEATVNSKHVKTSPWNHSSTFKSEGGEKFTSFAKYKDFDKDLYHDWVAPYYKSDVLVESWLNGPGSMNSTCTKPYKAYNIAEMKLVSKSFSVHQDHSKWAVTTDGQWTCIGDINRQVSQKKRAGGTVCFQIASVWKNFFHSIVKHQPCPKQLLTPQASQLNRLNW